MMRITKFFLLFCYSFSIYLFINRERVFVVWMCLEINLLSYIILVVSYTHGKLSNVSRSQGIYYFCIQSLGSFLFLLSYLSMRFSEYTTFSVWVIILGCLIKLGLFPFHRWVFKLSTRMTGYPFIILITLQKIPLYFFIFKIISSPLLALLIFRALVGVLILFYSRRIEQVIVASSIYVAVWFIFMFIISPKLTLTFYLIYVIQNFNVLWTNLTRSIKHDIYIARLSVIRFLAGLPPIGIFYVKFYFCSEFMEGVPFVYLVLIYLFGLIAIFLYLKFFWSEFFRPSYREYKRVKLTLLLPFSLLLLTILRIMFFF